MPLDVPPDAGNDEGSLAKINWNNERRKLKDLQPWSRNPRQINKAQAARLAESFNEFGQVETIAIGPTNEVYNGHQRLGVLLAKYGGEHEVEVRVASEPLTEKQREKLTVYLHKGAAGEWDFDMLANEFELDDLLDWGFEKRDLDIDLWQPEGETPEDAPVPDEELVMRVPDAVWGSDNLYGIPMLDINMQADHLEAPFMGWGTKARKNRMTGTYHFYVEDSRFEQVWRDPLAIANSACYAIVEPNFSVYTDMPKAVALWQMFRKRWITRWLQSIGIRAFVDLNIAHKHDDLRFIGVPEGWKAYCTRAYSARLDETIIEYEQAVRHAGGGTILFVCYGGGKQAEALSQEHGWIWYPDQQTQDAGGK